MKYPWLDSYLTAKPLTVKDYHKEWSADRYLLNGKVYAFIGQTKQGKTVITLKCAPEQTAEFRGKYPEVKPDYYMNKDHWNSVLLDGNLPDDVLKQLIDISYDIIFNSLPKVIRQKVEQA